MLSTAAFMFSSASLPPANPAPGVAAGITVSRKVCHMFTLLTDASCATFEGLQAKQHRWAGSGGVTVHLRLTAAVFGMQVVGDHV